jgi:phosphoglycolate phosphatase
MPAPGTPTLLLFDIDGTLILTGGAGARAMARAFEAVFGAQNAFRGVPMPGRTDPRILDDALARCGIQPDHAGIARFREEYRHLLVEELRPAASRKLVMPGVGDLLAVLAVRPETFLALLTGNYSESAQIKLEHFGLWDSFRCGAFGEDATERSGLVAVAIDRARALGAPCCRPEQVFVIGDTPLDVSCARAAGVRSIAVATGGFGVEALGASGAEVVFENLSDTAAFLRYLDENAHAACGTGAGA